MKRSKRQIRNLVVAVLAAQGILTSVAWADLAPPPSPSLQDITNKMTALQAQLDQLKAQQHQVMVEQEKQAIAEAVLQDAEQRTSFEPNSGITAGYKDRRFFIESEDGNFVLRPWIHIQIRNTTNIRQDSTGTGATSDSSNDVENGFELRRARLGFDGNLFTPDLTYFINWATYRASNTGNVYYSTGKTVTGGNTTGGPNTKSLVVENNIGGLPVLEEAWVKYHITGTPWYIKFGQLHDPLDHENIMGSKYRDPEASLQGDLFGNTDTFTQGATVIFDPKGCFRSEVGVTDGIYAANTSFQDPEINNFIYYNYGVAGRAEYKVMGNWKDYDQFTALNDKETLLVFGAGGDFSQGNGFGQFSHTLDAQFDSPSGLSFYTSYFGRYITKNPGIPLGAPVSATLGGSGTEGYGHDTYEPSIMAQAGYLINQKIEPYVRYEYLHLQGTPTGSENSVHEISTGVHYYFYGHNAKVTGQVMYLPNGIPVSDTSSDVLVDNGHAEVIIMCQFQLLL